MALNPRKYGWEVFTNHLHSSLLCSKCGESAITEKEESNSKRLARDASIARLVSVLGVDGCVLSLSQDEFCA